MFPSLFHARWMCLQTRRETKTGEERHAAISFPLTLIVMSLGKAAATFLMVKRLWGNHSVAPSRKPFRFVEESVLDFAREIRSSFREILNVCELLG